MEINGEHNDIILYEKMTKGNRYAFEILFKKYYIKMVAYANSYLHDIDNAENIVQNIFVHLWENKKNHKIKTPKNYLTIAVKNSCLNEIQKHRNQIKYKNSLQSEDFIIQTNYSDFKMMEYIKKAIDELPEQRKKIFKLNRLDGLKYKEIAEKLNISIKTVEVQMGKALKFLRSQLVDLKKQVYQILL